MFSSRTSASLVNPEAFSGFLTKVYGLMVGALIATGVTAQVANASGFTQYMIHHVATFWALAGLGLLAVMLVGSTKNVVVNYVLLAAYAVITGLTTSTVLAIYSSGTIAAAFAVSASVFTGAAVYGLVTKRSLEGFGQYLLLALFGLIVAMIVNLFLQSTLAMYLISSAAVVLFTLLTAYDSNKLRTLYNEGGGNVAAVHGALSLYLDFLNLFLHILQLFGAPKKD